LTQQLNQIRQAFLLSGWNSTGDQVKQIQLVSPNFEGLADK
jgi:hypothetical protein